MSTQTVGIAARELRGSGARADVSQTIAVLDRHVVWHPVHRVIRLARLRGQSVASPSDTRRSIDGAAASAACKIACATVDDIKMTRKPDPRSVLVACPPACRALTICYGLKH